MPDSLAQTLQIAVKNHIFNSKKYISEITIYYKFTIKINYKINNYKE